MNNVLFSNDTSDFPMIRLPEMEIFISWYPITKLQFEDFLCRTDQSQFDGEWYQEIREKNPRETASRLSSRNYWNAFLTGIKPDEVDSYVRELGMDYFILSFDDWFTMYQKAKQMEPIDISIVLSQVRNVAMRKLIERLDQILPRIARSLNPANEYKLADQMLMRHGVGEWIYSENRKQNWEIAGMPNANFHKQQAAIDQGRPIQVFQARLNDVDFSGLRIGRFADEI